MVSAWVERVSSTVKQWCPLHVYIIVSKKNSSDEVESPRCLHHHEYFPRQWSISPVHVFRIPNVIRRDFKSSTEGGLTSMGHNSRPTAAIALTLMDERWIMHYVHWQSSNLESSFWHFTVPIRRAEWHHIHKIGNSTTNWMTWALITIYQGNVVTAYNTKMYWY
jgi:hypothetical protein